MSGWSGPSTRSWASRTRRNSASASAGLRWSISDTAMLNLGVQGFGMVGPLHPQPGVEDLPGLGLGRGVLALLTQRGGDTVPG